MKKFMYMLMAAAAIFAVSCKQDDPQEEPQEETIEVPTDFSAMTQESAWGVTGAIASAEINWDNDIAMTTDGTWHVAKDVVLTATDEFKFRKDHDWAENFGGALVEAGKPFEVAQNGANIKVLADGTYTLLLNTEKNVAVAIAQ